MDRRIREAVRYLGFGRSAVDERTLGMITDAFASLESVVGFRSVCRTFDMSVKDDGTILAAGMEIKSKSLCRNLKDCKKIVLFGATLGTGVDRLISRHSIINMAQAVVLQACAAALLEEYCDIEQEKIGSIMKKEGLYLRPRFSPGYGDFDISYQEPIIRILECPKKIGLSMTDSYMMTPTKSVTALIGASRIKYLCPAAGCEVCGKKDCIYRR